MSKAKSKGSKKAAPQSGLIMGNKKTSGNQAKGSSFMPKSSGVSSSKKGGGMHSMPRKTS